MSGILACRRVATSACCCLDTSKARRLIDLETHQAVFTWVLQRLADAKLVKEKTIGIDATTLEANAALRSVHRPAGSRGSATHPAVLVPLNAAGLTAHADSHPRR